MKTMTVFEARNHFRRGKPIAIEALRRQVVQERKGRGKPRGQRVGAPRHQVR